MNRIVAFVSLVVCFPATIGFVLATTPSTLGASADVQVSEAYGKLPLSFEVNCGQTDAEVRFLSRGSGYTLFLTAGEAVLTLSKPEAQKSHVKIAAEPETADATDRQTTAPTVLHMQLIGANREPQLVGLDELPGKSNYFIGNDPKNWHTNIPTYAKVKYLDVYPGVDLVYYGNHSQLEYDFVLTPGADPSIIRLRFDGLITSPLQVDSKGNLVLMSEGRELLLKKPFIYQESDGRREEIVGEYVLRDSNLVGFEVGTYDVARPLVIDPVLVYSTYLGGSGGDIGYGITVDVDGNVYITGSTFVSPDFPTANPLQPTSGGSEDAFVAKLKDGSTLIYSTYLGGSGLDRGSSIAVDAAGNAYVTGLTSSTDFPTANPLQAVKGGGNWDTFVAKLNSDGSALLYSTYLGGDRDDEGYSIAVDAADNAYVTGSTASSDFPTVNPLQPEVGPTVFGGDAFVAKLTPDGSSLVYSTYLGGTFSDFGFGIAVDSARNAYITGGTESTDFPTANPLQPANSGFEEAFVTKLDPSGSTLIYSTYLGGGNSDRGADIALDESGNAYVTGNTSSSDFPTANPLQPVIGSIALGGDAFVAKLNPEGSSLVYSTYLGGSGSDIVSGIDVDASGNAYVIGKTESSDFPTANPLQPVLGSSRDAFVAKLNPEGSSLVYSTYLGGNTFDEGQAIAVDSAGSAYVTGWTSSADFPTANPLQPALGGGNNAFVARIADPTTVLLANFTNGNNDAFNSRVYLWNPSTNAGNVTVRVFTLPLAGGGLAQELTTTPLSLGILGAKSALNVKLAEDVLVPLGITLPYTDDNGDLTLEFTIEATDVRGAAQVFSSSLAFGTYPLQEIPSSTGSQTVLLANFTNGNNDAFNSRVYLFNPSESLGNVSVRVFALPLIGGPAQELTTTPLSLGTLGRKLARNIRLAEDILAVLGITPPYTTDGGNLTLEFTIEAPDVRGVAQVFSSDFAFGVYPLQEIPSTSTGSPTVLVANFMNGNNDAFNSRIYLWNPTLFAGSVTVRVFTLPVTGGLAQELTVTPLALGTLGVRSALNIKLAEDILTPLEIETPYTTDGGNLTLEFTIQAADVRAAAQVFSSNFGFGTYPLQEIPSTSSGSPTVLLANFLNGNNDAFNSRVYLWNPSESAGNVAVRVFTLPLRGGIVQELTGTPVILGTLGAKSALNIKLAEDILTPLGIPTPYTDNGGNLTLEFTVQAADVRGAAQVFSGTFGFGTYPLEVIQ